MPDDLFYSILVDPQGSAYELSEDISSLIVDEAAGKPDQLTIQMGDPFHLFSHALQVGLEIEVDLGSVKDHSLLFRGHIYKVEGDYPKNGLPTIRIIAYDHSMKLGLQKRTRLFTDKTLKDIVEETARPVFQKCDYAANDSEPILGQDGIRQKNETDLAFLYRLAEIYGYEMYVASNEQDDILNFISRKTIISDKAPLELCYNRTDVPSRLINFQSSSDVAQMEPRQFYSGINYDDGKPIDIQETPEPEPVEQDDKFLDESLALFSEKHPAQARSLASLINRAPASKEMLHKELGVTKVTVPGFVSQDELKALAGNQYRLGSQGMRGKGTAAGNHRLHAQLAIAVSGVGTFSTKWFVTQVRHTLNSQGYLTEFECQR